VEIAAFLSSCFLHLCFHLRSSPSLFCCLLLLLLLASSFSSFAPEKRFAVDPDILLGSRASPQIACSSFIPFRFLNFFSRFFFFGLFARRYLLNLE
jgi:hypothetical protein